MTNPAQPTTKPQKVQRGVFIALPPEMMSELINTANAQTRTMSNLALLRYKKGLQMSDQPQTMANQA